MKKIVIKSFFALIIISLFSACVQTDVQEADATFIILKDTIIDGKKDRVEVTVADTILPIYFVYKGESRLNSVWPGDRYMTSASIVSLDTTLVAGKLVIKKITKKINYFIYQDYGTRKDSVILSILPKKDTSMTQLAPIYQGVTLPFGTSEIQYTFKSKGMLTVTWIARNADGNSISEKIAQKQILVK